MLLHPDVKVLKYYASLFGWTVNYYNCKTCDENELTVRATSASIVTTHLQQIDVVVLTEHESDWCGTLIAVIIVKESNFCYPVMADSKRTLNERLVRKLNEFKSTFPQSPIKMLRFKSASGLNVNGFLDENGATKYVDK